MDDMDGLLPDFDKVEEMVVDLARIKAKLLVVKHKLAMLEATVIREAQFNNAYWVGGKRPSMTYCNEVVSKLGNTDEDREALETLRLELSQLVETEELLDNLISLSKDKLDLYRTICANERKGFL